MLTTPVFFAVFMVGQERTFFSALGGVTHMLWGMMV